MSAEHASPIDYGRPPDRTRLRRRLTVIAVALALVIGGTVTTVRVRQELARRAALLQAQQIARERARLDQVFARAQKELKALEAAKAQRDAAATSATTQRATTK